MTNGMAKKSVDLDKPALTIPEACLAFGINRATGYAAARQKRWPVVQVGDRTMRVPGAWVRQQLGLLDLAQPAQPDGKVEPTRQPRLADDRAARAEAFGHWCERAARDLLRLPPQLLGNALRTDLQNHLDRHDWIERDTVWLNELLRKFQDHIARL